MFFQGSTYTFDYVITWWLYSYVHWRCLLNVDDEIYLRVIGRKTKYLYCIEFLGFLCCYTYIDNETILV